MPEDDDFSDPAFVRLRDTGRGRVDLFAMAHSNKSCVTFDAASGERETARTQFVSGDAFERLGIGPAAGRLLTMQDDRRSGAPAVAVLSHAFWMKRFGGDRGIVGSWFVVHGPKEDRRFQIIGVTEPRFGGMEPGYPTDVWLPYGAQDPYAYASRFVETMLFEVAPLELSSVTLPLGTLLLAALVAAAVPAWRAARVDPAITLRND